MKVKILLASIILFAYSFNAYSQTEKVTEGKYQYSIVKNDPLKTRIYVLENGLTVYLSVNKDAPRIQTRITVRAGSKFDPADATGLAHYLEHLLFKGSSKFGTQDFEMEKPLLDKITELYESYRNTRDSVQRRFLYHRIDSVSLLASKIAIPNEYDKMLSAIGATGTNAYTMDEQTTYINDVPANQFEKWLIIESERFRQPIMRLFHTELEVVYEEKNRQLDNGDSKAYEALFSSLYQKHPYGTQTTIGTIEHLKNPSIQKVIDYFNTYYVPNNMAVCLVGDFNPDETIEMIDKYFGKFEKKEIPIFNPPIESEIDKPIYKEVVSPEAEYMILGYRFPGVKSKDADILQMVNYILSNGTAGLIDLNLVQNQKVLGAGSFIEVRNDYSDQIFYANPRTGQTLDELKELILSQIELLKKGDFPDWFLTAVINNMKVERIHQFQNTNSSVSSFVDAFTLNVNWEDYINKIDNLSKITKEDIIDFADRYYKNNYAYVYKKTGTDNNVQKVNKPEITPVDVNRDAESDFYKYISGIKAPEIQPVFLDYKNDFTTIKFRESIPLYYIKNNINELFSLYYVFDMGTDNDKKIGLAVNYLQYLGTSKLSPVELKREFFKIGCSFSVSNSENQTYIALSGLKENMDKGIGLLESLIADPQPNEPALKNLISDILKNRTDDKLSKDKILYSAMVNFGIWGKSSSFTNILGEKELNNLKSDELISIIKKLTAFEHEIIYYGPENNENIVKTLNLYHNTPDRLFRLPDKKKFTEQPTDENNVYVVDYDMKQAEIIMLSKGEKFNKELIPIIRLYNTYAGNVVFQELREAKALAYSVYAYYSIAEEKDLSGYSISYIGTQSDKLKEALDGLTGILNDMPLTDVFYNSAKEGVLQKIRTQRILRTDIIFNYLNARKLGLDYDIRKDVFEKVNGYSLSDLKQFLDNYIKNKKYTILVLGDKNKLDKKVLEKFGKVKYLTLDEIFGY